MARSNKHKITQSKQAVGLFKKIWKRLKDKDARSWSLRQISRELNISPGYLSKIFSGQMPLTLDLAEKLVVTLKADDMTKRAVLSCFVEKSGRAESLLKKITPMEEYEIPADSAELLLKKWYHLPLLDLMTTKSFQSNSTWISNRLGCSIMEVETALKTLVEEGLAILEPNGTYKKKHLKIRFPATISKSVIREHHKAQMKRAQEELEVRITPKDFNNRLVIGLSIACNPKHLPEVKEYLHAALYEAAELLSQDPCSEVYQLNLQLFPQTK